MDDQPGKPDGGPSLAELVVRGLAIVGLAYLSALVITVLHWPSGH